MQRKCKGKAKQMKGKAKEMQRKCKGKAKENIIKNMNFL